MASNILSARLARLTRDGALERRVYQERPPRHEYVLTSKGRDLYAAIVMLMRWGDRWLAGRRGPPLILFHKLCGQPLDPRVTCSACGGVLDPHEVSYELADASLRRIAIAAHYSRTPTTKLHDRRARAADIEGRERLAP